MIVFVYYMYTKINEYLNTVETKIIENCNVNHILKSIISWASIYRSRS